MEKNLEEMKSKMKQVHFLPTSKKSSSKHQSLSWIKTDLIMIQTLEII